ncbi:hypothetical protein SESBI_07357 [Sesbania bispinosa]|nr:hypothetical protein SESBI_07357 [Sesbania bispinosa]
MGDGRHVDARVEDSEQREMTQNRRKRVQKGRSLRSFRVTWMGERERSGSHETNTFQFVR